MFFDKIKYTALFLSVFWMQSFFIHAQNPVIKASLDSVSIAIGSQAKIRLEITKPAKSNVEIPIFRDTIISGIEIVDITRFDTLTIAHDQEQINIDYLITSFDEGLYYIPPFAVVAQIDTFYSDFLTLKVIQPFGDIDTTRGPFDIKQPMSPKIVPSDYIFILIIIWIISVILVVLAYFFLLRPKKKKEILAQKRNIPPHIKALHDLEEVKQKQLWQKGLYKEYYTQLTDVLRIYLHERFGIDALEMTSNEILFSVQARYEAESAYENLYRVLKLADLVKFAKFKPLPNENELSYMNARLFVSQTQPEEIKPNEKEEEQSNLEQ